MNKKQLYESKLRSPKALANAINNNLFGGDFNELNYYGKNQDEENFRIYCRAINGYWRKTSRPGICFSKDEIDFMYNNWNDIMSDALCENKQTKNMNKKQLYESIMKNVAIQVKKALNESEESLYPEIRVELDTFAHLIYGESEEDLEDEDIAYIKREMRKFAKELAENLKAAFDPIKVKVTYRSGFITIHGITDDIFWEYIDVLKYIPFPGDLYWDDFECFLPDNFSDIFDINEVQKYVEDAVLF